MRIGELLVRQGLITEEDVQRVLAEQKRRGGKFGTNLVALKLVSDQRLACVLGEQLGFPCAQWAMFESIPSDVIRLVPAEVAEMSNVIPLEKSGLLRLGAAEPVERRILERIEELGGVRCEVVISPEIWIVAALERYYNVSRDWRFLAEASELAPDRSDLAERLLKSGTFPPDPGDECAVGFPLRLNASDTPREAMNETLAFLWAEFPRAAVFVVGKKYIEGWIARGFPTHAGIFKDTRLPVGKAGVLRAAAIKGKEYRGPLPADAREKALLDPLGIDGDETVCVFPVPSLGETPAVFVGFGREGLVLDEASLDRVRWALSKAGLMFVISGLRRTLLGASGNLRSPGISQTA